MFNLSRSIEADDYISKLLDLFLMCDDLENTEALHQLYSIFKTVFMLNKNALFELMFSSENLMKVVGVMEYDPCKKAPVKHRHFLENQVCVSASVMVSHCPSWCHIVRHNVVLSVTM